MHMYTLYMYYVYMYYVYMYYVYIIYIYIYMYCYKITFEKYRTNYLQVSSNVATMELSMHGNPLVIISCYLPHDAVLQHIQPKRTAAWDELHDTINKTTEAKNLIVCGDFNAALHHRKEGEEDVIGQHVFRKGGLFLATKEDRMPY